MIPTAQEFLEFKTPSGISNDYPDYWEAMITFTKLHVEQALKTASENATLLVDGKEHKFHRYIVDYGHHYNETEIDISKDSILNAYPLTLIK